MDNELVDGPSGAQPDLNALSQRVDALEADVETLRARADDANQWATASDERVEADRRRIDDIELRLDLDREMIAELQADGVLGQENTAHLMEALRSSRQIGAAIGIVMAHRKVSEQVAFEILSLASQNANRKLRVIAGEVIYAGDVSTLPVAPLPRDG